MYLKANTFQKSKRCWDGEGKNGNTHKLRKYVKLYITHNGNVHRVYLGRNNKPDIGKRMTKCCFMWKKKSVGANIPETHVTIPQHRTGMCFSSLKKDVYVKQTNRMVSV